MREQLPVVGIPCDFRMTGEHAFHMVGEKYIDAVRDAAGATPLLIPVLDRPLSPQALVRSVDGLLFPGSPSNIAPQRYGGPGPRKDVLGDERRDATTLDLLVAAIAAAVPVLCICRGFQELNVAFGGTLHQHVHELEGRMDHRSDKTASLEVQYAPSHDVRVIEGCLLDRIAGTRAFRVNSLHSQGIDRLAPQLNADAVAADGQVEAASMPTASGFVLGVQWHPEWRWREDPVSGAILSAFGAAVRREIPATRDGDRPG